ncbi:SRR1-like protein [Alligator mississippiensis]|uniref:SRR1-like protein n=1 Tax=Alligator mississippiensis TaxID=8496 RepID=UPI002877A26B|nr:SRR1-like protein [Alligator mississippiensis]
MEARRRRRRRREAEEPSPAERAAALQRRLLEARDALRGEAAWEHLRAAVGTALGGRGAQAEEPPPRCVCYGLGSVAACAAARPQLALLLLLLDELQVPRERCRVFDPVFSALDVAVLAELGLAVVSENEEGKHPAGDGTTLFYMIHCGKALYNNLLWSNWSVAALSKIIIVGNSFRGIEERLLSRILERDYSYIAKVLKGTEEIPLPTHPQYADVFNDTSVHWFPLPKLEELPSDTWLFQEEPTYQECEDLEIIRKQDKGSILRSTQNEVES